MSKIHVTDLRLKFEGEMKKKTSGMWVLVNMIRSQKIHNNINNDQLNI